MSKYTRFFYYEPADYQACEEHMAEALVAWFPQVEDMTTPALWGTWDIDAVVAALLKSGDLLETQFLRLGVRMGPVERNCSSLH
ncbi:hypothetical protein [Streptomyces sp. NPDC047525]|uniref:hypothetical protein n=1 Tax=Streptomyces sp. NPDC047525 TaxID=3155264 RepID=UPI0033DA42EF